MKYLALQEFIKQYGEDDDFTGGVDESQINVVQNVLGGGITRKL